MKVTRRDLAGLQGPLLALCIASALAATMLVWSTGKFGRAAQEHAAAQLARTRSEDRLRQAPGEARDLAERAGTFGQLQTLGILGEEKRLEWTEMLSALQNELHVAGLSYEFAAQAALDAASTSRYGYFNSPLHLQLQVLHEEELLNFLARLEKEAKALVLLQGCHVTRLPQPHPTARLGADCRMRWITVRPQRSGK